LVARLDARDDAPDPRPAFGAVVEFGEAADLGVGRQRWVGGLDRGIAGQGGGVPMQRRGAG
jgi:hypothetical protein